MAVVPIAALAEVARVVNNACTHMAVGTGETAEAVSDIQLDVETARKPITKKLTFGKKLQERTLFTNSELPDNTKEFGLFISADDNPNTGILLTRSETDFNKGNNDLLVVTEIELDEA